MCTSDSGSSVPCEKNPEGQVPSGQCSAEFGNDFCYVLVTRQKQPVEKYMWNSKSDECFVMPNSPNSTNFDTVEVNLI